MRRNIGMIFQHFNLVKRSSVLRNVLSGRVGYHPTWKKPTRPLSTFRNTLDRLTKLKCWKIIPIFRRISNNIQGKSITKAHGKALLEMRRNIGMIFQHFNLVKRS
jgi:ABC-type phosphate/phosphonate transport system ATPase subunit